ncbi:Hpt domain-containing protein [Vibrio sp. FNV 38]|nr:Hpt domain-containing protein [Vibrio sp. FNV 38]
MKFHKGYIALVIWLLATLTGVFWLRAEYAVLTALEELDSEIQETRTLVSIKPVYQTNHLEHLALSTHLINALKLELLVSQQESFFTQDVNQLIMLVNRFTHLTEQLSDNQLRVVDLLDQLGRLMEQNKTNPQVHALLTELGSLTFIAMFGDPTSNAFVYRDLDRLYTLSLELPEEDRQPFQSVLAQSSDTLGAHAQGAYLIEQLVSFEVSRHITDLRQELLSHIRIAGMTFSFISLIPVLLLFWSSASDRKRGLQLTADQGEALTDEDSSLIDESEAFKSNDSKRDHSEPKPLTTRVSNVDYEYMLDSVNGDDESVSLLLGVFVEDHEKDAEKIAHLIAERDPDALRAAHSLKGVAASIGAMPLKEISATIEANLTEGRVSSRQELELLDVYLTQTIKSAMKHT